MTYAKVLTAADQNVVFFLHRMTRRNTLRFCTSIISGLGSLSFTCSLGVLLLILVKLNPLSFSFILSQLVVTAIAQLIKAKVNRKRPFQCLDEVCYHGPVLKDCSFPSGHTTSVFTSAAIFSFFFPQWTILLFLLATLVGFSRIILGAHYPSDVIIGAILGTSLPTLLLQIIG